MSRFADRTQAGQELARELRDHSGAAHTIVLGLARGGVPVAHALARELRLPFDVFLVRKLGVPGHEELAMGAIASGGVRVVNSEVVNALGLPAEVIDAVARDEQRELERRGREYRDGRAPAGVVGLTAIVVDDGAATGSSMRAAVQALRQRKAARIVVGVPVAPAATCAQLEHEADAVVCPCTPDPFRSVGTWYVDFEQTTDEQVRALIADAARFRP